MTFGERMIGAAKLDVATFEDIERDQTAMGHAVGVIALAALAGGLANIWYGGVTGIVSGFIMMIVGYVIWAVIVWVVGTKLMPDPATKADFPETFRVISFAAVPWLLAIVTIIPLLGWLLMFIVYPVAWLWSMAIMVIAVRQVLDYTDTFKAVIVVVIGFFVVMLVWLMFVMLGLSAAFFGAALSR